jgi:hypothetical protein
MWLARHVGFGDFCAGSGDQLRDPQGRRRQPVPEAVTRGELRLRRTVSAGLRPPIQGTASFAQLETTALRLPPSTINSENATCRD